MPAVCSREGKHWGTDKYVFSDNYASALDGNTSANYGVTKGECGGSGAAGTLWKQECTCWHGIIMVCNQGWVVVGRCMCVRSRCQLGLAASLRQGPGLNAKRLAGCGGCMRWLHWVLMGPLMCRRHTRFLRPELFARCFQSAVFCHQRAASPSASWAVCGSIHYCVRTSLCKQVCLHGARCSVLSPSSSLSGPNTLVATPVATSGLPTT